MNRKENGSSGPRKGGAPRGKPPAGRRMPPPDATHEEGRYIRELKESETVVAVTLSDGRVVQGTITYYDTEMIKLAADEGPPVFVRKAEILTIAELS
jgi:hypothetical protein